MVKTKKIQHLDSTYSGTYKGVGFIVSKQKGFWGAMTDTAKKMEFGDSTKKSAIANIIKYIEKKL
ncbi:hypothetical protein GD1_222 [Paraglaciecola Antarctic GD virus 1]|nr:hypothetical protein GD1_222 [Paraglaciecola Antarctic GD virus 1]